MKEKMSNVVKNAAAQMALENLISKTVDEMESVYLETDPKRTPEEFQNEILGELEKAPDTDGAKLLKEFKRIQDAEQNPNAKHWSMLLTLAYCVQATRELDKEPPDREAAWSYMADTRYWSGVTFASKGLEIARQKTIDATRKNTATKGGHAAAEARYAATIQKTYELVKANRPKNGWQSKRQAAKNITPEVCDFAHANGKPLSADNAAVTIYGWILKMPDFSTLLNQKQAKK